MKIDLTEVLQKTGNEAEIETSLDQEKVFAENDGLKLTQPVKVRLRLLNTGVSVLVKGKIKAEIELECSRCLNKFKQPFDVKLEEAYSLSPVEHQGSGEIELQAQDFVYPIAADNTIDLTETIRQNLLLAIPIKILCQENCQGMDLKAPDQESKKGE